MNYIPMELLADILLRGGLLLPLFLFLALLLRRSSASLIRRPARHPQGVPVRPR
jgi:hypothetical protein